MHHRSLRRCNLRWDRCWGCALANGAVLWSSLSRIDCFFVSNRYGAFNDIFCSFNDVFYILYFMIWGIFLYSFQKFMCIKYKLKDSTHILADRNMSSCPPFLWLVQSSPWSTECFKKHHGPMCLRQCQVAKSLAAGPNMCFDSVPEGLGCNKCFETCRLGLKHMFGKSLEIQ